MGPLLLFPIINSTSVNIFVQIRVFFLPSFGFLKSVPRGEILYQRVTVLLLCGKMELIYIVGAGKQVFSVTSVCVILILFC